ncbi:MAG: type II restriction endonuclease [Bacteroides sp.]|nr:type II restriction endonuclease [Bacteroides sp.]
MPHDIQTFITPLKDTHFSLADYVDFEKVISNVDAISIKLNQLNYLIGQQDMAAAVQRLWDENPKVFSVLEILIAIRSNKKKKAIDEDGLTHPLSYYLDSPEHVTDFLNKTGLTKIFQSEKIKNLVDYVFGIEVGLDSNARKNRGGKIMENLVASIFDSNGIVYKREVYYSVFPEIERALGVDNKRFDFVIQTPQKTYLIETNFYADGGSKLNEVARAYSELAPKINAVAGFEFVWITDGIGWMSARNKLQEALEHIPSVYNLTTINDLIESIK